MNPILVIGPLILFLVAIEIVLLTKRNQAVKNSRERYLLTTWRKVANWGVLLTAFVGIATHVNTEHWYVAIIYTINALLAVHSEYLESKRDEDDWFNGRGKKIFNKLKSTFTIRKPVPVFNN